VLNKNTSIEVVVGIIHNSNNEVFIAKRQKNQFMAGYWELPGGKVEHGEDHVSAIVRELFEETGIIVKDCHLVQEIQHIYPEKTINLSVYSIDNYLGEPLGFEGQEITWSSEEKFKNFKLLPTMWRIIHKFSLPKFYWITPDDHQSDMVINECKKQLTNGIKFIQLRSKTSLDHAYIKKINRLCKESQAKLILNTPSKTLKERPVIEEKLIGASTHNLEEALHAENISADYISLSPIEKTLTHPDSPPLGWEDASGIIEKCNLPVFLLGGMKKNLIEKALSIGAQGVAGIRDI
jgi:8-oxo-dGTP diphosphatase